MSLQIIVSGSGELDTIKQMIAGFTQEFRTFMATYTEDIQRLQNDEDALKATLASVADVAGQVNTSVGQIKAFEDTNTATVAALNQEVADLKKTGQDTTKFESLLDDLENNTAAASAVRTTLTSAQATLTSVLPAQSSPPSSPLSSPPSTTTGNGVSGSPAGDGTGGNNPT